MDKKPPKDTATGEKRAKPFISNIILLGLTSLFMDMSSEMVYPLIPLYLAAFGATPLIIGLIEGIAESLAALLRAFSGWWGDRTGHEKRLTVAGYSASVLYKLLLFFSTGWGGVLFARIVDRAGKGIRTAPRDALIAASGGDKRLGQSFGLHKMMDMAGSAIGVALAFVIVWAGMSFQSAFMLSLIPAGLGLIAVCLVRKNKDVVRIKNKAERIKFRLNGRLIGYLAVIFVFNIGNSSNAFLLLKTSDMGFNEWQVVLVYLMFNVTSSLFAYPFGKLSDKIGRGKLLFPGYFLYGVVYIGFALATSSWMIPILFCVYGLYTALIGGAERAFLVEQSPLEYRGTVLGLHGMCQGLGLLIASLLAGGLWGKWGSDMPFLVGGIIGFACAIAVGIISGLIKRRNAVTHS